MKLLLKNKTQNLEQIYEVFSGDLFSRQKTLSQTSTSYLPFFLSSFTLC